MLGEKVKDRLSKFTGTAVARAEYLYGCVWVGVVPEGLNNDGKPIEDVWFDEARLESVKKKEVEQKKRDQPYLSVGRHGPMPSAPVRSFPNPSKST